MEAQQRTIAVLTGTRADYGLLRHLIVAIDKEPRARLKLIASGTHLAEEHGGTVREILDDGIEVAARVPIWSGGDTPVAAARDFGTGVAAFAGTLEAMRPDVVVLLGDRLEALAMANAATILGIPLAHIHGGEITEGAMDDSMRHAITKLSYLHFTTTEAHRARVVQLGEDPSRVFNFGATVLDAMRDLSYTSAAELNGRFGLDLNRRSILMTFHPAAFERVDSPTLLRSLLSALDSVPDSEVIITGTNSDIGSGILRRMIAAFVESHPDRARYVESFGQLNYLSVMKEVGLVVGNSSSTVLEAPLLGVPSVLVGDRQDGRPLSASVLKPDPEYSAIREAILTGLSTEFQRSIDSEQTVFGTAGFARRALEILITEDLSSTRKRFWDIGDTVIREPGAKHE